MEAQLSKFVNDHQRDWDKLVPLLLMAYRTSVHETTDQTPARLMLVRDLRLPIDLLIGRPEMEHTKSDFASELQEQMEVIHQFTKNSFLVQSDRMKEYYD